MICLGQEIVNSDLDHLTQHDKSPHDKKFEGGAKWEESIPDFNIECLLDALKNDCN